MTIPLDTVVNVDVNISAGSNRTREYRTLFVTNDENVLDGRGSNKSRSYDAASALEQAYDQDVKDAAAAYFAQNRYPNSMRVGRWVNADVNSVLTGGAPADAADIDNVSDGSFSFAGEDFMGVNFSAAATYTAQAVILATTINSSDDISGATVVYDAANSRFVVEVDPSVPATPFAPHSQGTATDISALLGLTTATGANLVLGAEQETLTDALNAIRSADQDFYCLALSNTWANNLAIQTEAIQWAAANHAICISDTSGAEALVTGETTSVTAQLANLRSNASVVNWSETLDYKCMSVAGQICSRNLDAPRSAYTLKFKQLQGRSADSLDSAQKAELDRKQVNVFSNYQGGRAFYGEGFVTGNYRWLDIPVYTTWFADRMQADILTYLSAPGTKIPQTIEGVNGLLSEMDGVCIAGVTNGGIAPGSVSARLAQEIRSVTEDDEFDGELSNGYMNYVSPLADQTQAERESRSAPPAYSWIKLSAAMHSANISVQVEQ